MHNVTIYTDGACSGNPGPGGWGAVLICGEMRKELGGGEAQTTNNRMEILAAIKGLEALKTRCRVEIYSDSSYLVDAHLKGWLYNWERSSWLRKGTPIPNADLWQQLLINERLHEKVTFHKVSGHSGVPENERCDKIATSEAAKFV